jgi:hypothetical protein
MDGLCQPLRVALIGNWRNIAIALTTGSWVITSSASLCDTQRMPHSYVIGITASPNLLLLTSSLVAAQEEP